MIDSQLQKELRNRFNPEGSLLREHQLRMLDMLIYIDKVCKAQNIPYWLGSGTLLGAVRHRGFIPWDDDVDIEMLGEDYERFIKFMETECDNRFTIQTHKSDSSYILQFAKLRDLHSTLKETTPFDRDYKFRGICIDIFPMEPAPPRIINLLGGYCFRACVVTNKINSPTIRKICRKINYFIAFNIIGRIIRPFYNKHNKLLSCRFGSGFYEQHHIDDIFPLNKIEFEGYSFSVPKDVDKYLTINFGNYMKLPNIEDIHNHISELGIDG